MSGWLPYAFGLAASASTWAGGILAMRFGRRRDLLFGLTGGMVIGLALLDLCPRRWNMVPGRTARTWSSSRSPQG